MSHAECVWDLQAELGEGPVWRASDETLWFVDIKQPQVHCYDTRANAGRSWPAPAQVSFLAPTHDGRFVCGLQTGLHLFDPNSGAFTFIRAVEPDQPGNRLNDGFVDAKGRLWFGSMDDACEAPTGALYRFDGAELARCDEGYIITNGPCISPDGHTFYHTDTPKRLIYAYDLDVSGGLSNKRIFARVSPGGPDGSVVDSKGCLWTALWGGGGINRYGPDGALLAFYEMPVPNVTKVAFGGPDLSTLYITTAWQKLALDVRASAPQSGGLFRLDVEATGLKQGELAVW